MPAVYRKHGIHFLYPENWQLTDEADGKLPAQVSIQTPTGGFWSLQVFPAQKQPAELMTEIISELKRQYEDIELSPCERERNDGSTEGINAFFYCFDFLVCARIQIVSMGQHTLAVWYQDEVRDFDAAEPVFRAITASLLRES